MTDYVHIPDAEEDRPGYVYSAGGVGVPNACVQGVLAAWAAISPDGNPATALRYVNQGALNEVQNLARIAAQGALQALKGQS